MDHDFLGETVREADPPGIGYGRRVGLIGERPNLVPPECLESIGP